MAALESLSLGILGRGLSRRIGVSRNKGLEGRRRRESNLGNGGGLNGARFGRGETGLMSLPAGTIVPDMARFTTVKAKALMKSLVLFFLRQRSTGLRASSEMRGVGTRSIS
jgi:hypothetical protein